MSNILTSIGLVLDIVGAVTVAWVIIASRKKARELSTPNWDFNEAQFNDRLAQATATTWGLVALVLGFLLQLTGVWVK